MTSRQLLAIVGQLDELDKGRQVPNLPGPYGAFLARYARERQDVIHLALERRIPVRRDGAISGSEFKRITAIPLSMAEAAAEFDTPWGKIALILVLCPELMSLVSLRLWLSAASARDAYRNLLSNRDAALRVYGDFRWLPPGAITAGTAEFELGNPNDDDSWPNTPYLKATGDDISDLPHALDYRYVMLRRRGVLAHFRTFLASRSSDGAAVVPGGIRPKAVSLHAKNVGVVQWTESNLALCLGYQEPGERDWTIWRSISVEAGAAITHNIRWATFMRRIAGEGPPDASIVTACRAALEEVGVSDDNVNVETWDIPALADQTLDAFNRSVLARLLLGT